MSFPIRLWLVPGGKADFRTGAGIDNGETTDTAWSILSDFIVPALLGKSIAAEEASSLMSSIRGHGMARACAETLGAKMRALILVLVQ